MLGSTYTVDRKMDGWKTGHLFRTLLKQMRQKIAEKMKVYSYLKRSKYGVRKVCNGTLS